MLYFPGLPKIFLQHPFNDNELWIDLHKNMGIELSETLKTLPDDQQPDIERIKTFYTVDHKKKDDTVIEHLGDWRNSFMFPNMKYIVDIGIKNDLDTYFLVGFFHVDNLEKSMKDSYRDKEVVSAISTESFPNEYRHLLLN